MSKSISVVLNAHITRINLKGMNCPRKKLTSWLTGGKRMSKYKSVKTVIDGIKFDSKAEGEFYLYLRRKEDKGEIALIGVHPKVRLQDKFSLAGKTYPAITYAPDFHVEFVDGRELYFDVKGISTPVALLKYKMYMHLQYTRPEFARVPLLWVKLERGLWVDYFSGKPINLDGETGASGR